VVIWRLRCRPFGIASFQNVTDTLDQKNGILQTLGRRQDDHLSTISTCRIVSIKSIFIAQWGCSVLHVSCQIGLAVLADARPSAASHHDGIVRPGAPSLEPRTACRSHQHQFDGADIVALGTCVLGTCSARAKAIALVPSNCEEVEFRPRRIAGCHVVGRLRLPSNRSVAFCIGCRILELGQEASGIVRRRVDRC
jgi:hypothetical protein